MASVLGVRQLKLSLFKRASGNPSYEWVNTYEIDLGPGGTLGSEVNATELIQAFADAEAEVHLNFVQYTRGVLSTWSAEAAPYDPTSFMELALTPLVGARTPSADPLPRNAALWVARSVNTGRLGKLFFRGALQETEVTGGTSLLPQLESASITFYTGVIDAMFAAFDAAVNEAVTGAWVALLSNILVGGTPTLVTRAVTGLVVRGLTYVKPDHRYFDVGP